MDFLKGLGKNTAGGLLSVVLHTGRTCFQDNVGVDETIKTLIPNQKLPHQPIWKLLPVSDELNISFSSSINDTGNFRFRFSTCRSIMFHQGEVARLQVLTGLHILSPYIHATTNPTAGRPDFSLISCSFVATNASAKDPEISLKVYSSFPSLSEALSCRYICKTGCLQVLKDLLALKVFSWSLRSYLLRIFYLISSIHL